MKKHDRVGGNIRVYVLFNKEWKYMDDNSGEVPFAPPEAYKMN
jgi:hypothetical protein